MKVGFVGLGQMGEGMAMRIAGAGYDLSVRDLRKEPLERLAGIGAAVMSSNFELGGWSDIACVAVLGEKAVRQVCLGDEHDRGLIAGLKRGSILVVHCTLPERTISDLAHAAADRGVLIIDATLTGGGEPAAREGRLTLMVGGDAAVLERCRPVLQATAAHIFHVGRLGAGVKAKTINNFVVATGMATLREALEIARGVGIPESTMLEIFGVGRMATSWKAQNWNEVRRMEDMHEGGSMVTSVAKDMEEMKELAEEGGTIAPLAAHMTEVLPCLVNGLTRDIKVR